MDFELNDEQRQLADSLERMLAQHYDMDARKRIIADPGVHGAAVWKQLAELGILSIPLSEAAGGFGGGAVDLMQPMALLGRSLAVEPVNAHLSACVLLDRLATAGDATPARAAERELLAACGQGSARLAWARVDGSGDVGVDDPLRASGGGAGTTLSGTKVDVEGAAEADWLVVSTDDAVYLVPARTEGITMRSSRLLDGRRSADVSFRAVRLPAAGAGAGGPIAGDAAAAIREALDFSAALVCAEAMGVIDYACEATLEYLKTRKQFGVAIGNFQVLQHRIVDLYIELEQVRSMSALACSRVDAARAGLVDAAARERSVAAARVLVARATRKVAQEAVQMHGGMGMAEEMKISHAFRRLTVLGQQGESASSFLDRFIASGAATA
ncbi:MAG: acyl-CoA dehydrogenase family protein [Lautropia sp.]